MLGAKLDDLVHHATENGYSTRFVSNGYWAHTLNHARKRINRLVSQGLKEATFSTGDMHSKYVKPEYVRFGAIACAEAGIPVYVAVEMFKKAAFDLNGFVGEHYFKKLLDDKKILLTGAPWMKFAGSTEVDYSLKYRESSHASATGCESIFETLAINPSEDLIACSGLAFEEIPELHLGSLKTRSMKEIMASAPADFIKIWIHVQGPLAVIKYANSIDPSIRVPNESVHICEHCRSMYRDPNVLRVVWENPPPDKDEIIAFFNQRSAVKVASRISDPGWFTASRKELYADRARAWTPKEAKKMLELVKS